ncbi:MAG TPA: HI0074 family nucleotidyltransferase substrate-binding subunit [Candidatus Babeliales bacterium]|nr:HI0074 family nucleotidyltransferase substrate-binding subunit [Candidatus Babeliales bacterium]
MEKLEKKYNNLVKIHRRLATAIEKYKEALADENADCETIDLIRDSLIKRFELTYDLLWKYLREYVIAVRGVAIDSPRKVFQECLSLGLTNREETVQLVDLIEDRNLTTHVYDIDLANKVAADIQKHHDVIQAIIMKASPNTLKK